ncbi:MAG TPA: methyltransferase domain-containing protein [Gaiellaceae bacterium]|jgi:SAM-dependent methyltransferase
MPFEELKQKHSVVWGTGPYERVSATLADMHDELVGRLGPGPDVRWLDAATGTGEVAKRAARDGADVVGLDLAPGLIETAKREAGEEGLDVDFEVGDAEAMPYDDASFDVISSAVGVMFAPDHAAIARELGRVCMPGGRIGLACWRPDSTIGDVFRVMAPFQPAPPPPGAGSPFDWGREEHVTELLGGDFELELVGLESLFVVPSGMAAWELFSTSYGPTKVLADGLDPDRRAELAEGFEALHEEYRDGDEIRMPRTYLLTLGTRR